MSRDNLGNLKLSNNFTGISARPTSVLPRATAGTKALGCALMGTFLSVTVACADESQDLAKQLSNPIASLISVPIQGNYDSNIGSADTGDRLQFNVQPVMPISINDDWNMISRTILPIVYQDEIFPSAGNQFGLGDTVQSLFFSPKEIGPGGIIWGAGPVFLVPTGTDSLLSSGKWGAGPTAVVLKQTGPLTVGFLGTTSGRLPVVTERPRSARLSCNRSFLTQRQMPGLSHSTRKRVTTGQLTSGRCRLMRA